MAHSKLLFLLGSDASVDGDWPQILTGFEVRQVHTVAEAHQVLSAERMDCALVAGAFPDLSFGEVLELLQPLDSLLPFVFHLGGMTAADSVRLVRMGAYHCFNAADSLDSLREGLQLAAEERRYKVKVWNRSDNPEDWRRSASLRARKEQSRNTTTPRSPR